jgi:hypothetical protein
MRRSRVAAAGVVLSAVLVASAAALAHSGGAPSVDRVDATVIFTHASTKTRVCEGQDGLYVEQRVRATGTVTGDARLSGNLTFDLELLAEAATGDGFQQGKVVIRDPATGRKKVVANEVDAGMDEISQGMLFGRIHSGGRGDDGDDDDDDGGRSERLFANWRLTFHVNGAVSAQIGGETADGRLPAVAVSGRCTGPFESAEVDLPPPPATATATLSSGRRMGWLPAR